MRKPNIRDWFYIAQIVGAYPAAVWLVANTDKALVAFGVWLGVVVIFDVTYFNIKAREYKKRD